MSWFPVIFSSLSVYTIWLFLCWPASSVLLAGSLLERYKMITLCEPYSAYMDAGFPPSKVSRNLASLLSVIPMKLHRISEFIIRKIRRNEQVIISFLPHHIPIVWNWLNSAGIPWKMGSESNLNLKRKKLRPMAISCHRPHKMANR